MSETGGASIDLARREPWYGLKPGLPRAKVVAHLTAQGLTDFDDPEDPEWMIVEEWGLDLHFDEAGEQTLRQIAISDEDANWNGTPVIGQPLHSVIELIGANSEAAGWRPENAVDYVMQDREAIPATRPIDDESLLRDGTLWLPLLRFGLVMEKGQVSEIVWRLPEDVPRETCSPLTDAQLELSRSGKAVAEVTPRKPTAVLRFLSTVIFVLALIGLGVFAVQTKQHWDAAPSAKGRVIKIEDEHKKPFRQFFEIEFVDDEGRTQRGTIQRKDFYITPKEIGEEVDITYLSTTPVQLHGPASDRDYLFLNFMPIFASVFVGYAVLQLILGWLDTKILTARNRST